LSKTQNFSITTKKKLKTRKTNEEYQELAQQDELRSKPNIKQAKT
jgi:hypothetical protein